MSTVLNVLHVVTAVFIIGPMAILPMTAMRAIRTGHGHQVGSLAKSTFVFSLLSLITAILGFGVIGTWKLSVLTPWVLWSIILYVIALLISLFVVVPAMRGASAALVSGDGTASAGSYPRIAAGSGIVSLLLLVVVVLMVWKP